VQLVIDVAGNAAVIDVGVHRVLSVLAADAPVNDDFDLLDASQAGHEVLVEVWTMLADDHEDAHAGSLPRRLADWHAIFCAWL
jgi:hypothetical protein